MEARRAGVLASGGVRGDMSMAKAPDIISMPKILETELLQAYIAAAGVRQAVDGVVVDGSGRRDGGRRGLPHRNGHGDSTGEPRSRG